MNWKYFLGLEILGFILIIYGKWIVDMTERFDFAERWFGPAGTYTLYKLLGLGAIIFGFYALYNM